MSQGDFFEVTFNRISFKGRFETHFNMALSQTSEPEKTQGTDATNKQKRMKWTEEMNNVLLECKQTTISLTTSDNPPGMENGRKKGYMKIMKDLWEETEYRH